MQLHVPASSTRIIELHFLLAPTAFCPGTTPSTSCSVSTSLSPPHTTVTMAGPPQSTAHHQPPTLSRRRPLQSGDEAATAQLHLGDMEDTPCLSVAECNELLSRLAEKGGRPPANSEVYLKTREYVSLFARFKDSKSVEQVDVISSALLGKGELGGVTAFERAQLGMLFSSLL